jgi:DNA (cytosine-5)-methyltransferase 3A
MSSKKGQETFKVGDMVWTKVGGYPYWPGQVMNPETAPEKAKRTFRKGKVLVSFFGDNTHGCYNHAQLSNFEKHVAKYRHGVGAKGVRF